MNTKVLNRRKYDEACDGRLTYTAHPARRLMKQRYRLWLAQAMSEGRAPRTCAQLIADTVYTSTTGNQDNGYQIPLQSVHRLGSRVGFPFRDSHIGFGTYGNMSCIRVHPRNPDMQVCPGFT